MPEGIQCFQKIPIQNLFITLHAKMRFVEWTFGFNNTWIHHHFYYFFLWILLWKKIITKELSGYEFNFKYQKKQFHKMPELKYMQLLSTTFERNLLPRCRNSKNQRGCFSFGVFCGKGACFNNGIVTGICSVVCDWIVYKWSNPVRHLFDSEKRMAKLLHIPRSVWKDSLFIFYEDVFLRHGGGASVWLHSDD